MNCRYEAHTITGWTIDPGRTFGRYGTSFSIIDTCTGDEVFSRYYGEPDDNGHIRGYVRRRRDTMRELQRLNTLSRIYDKDLWEIHD